MPLRFDECLAALAGHQPPAIMDALVRALDRHTTTHGKADEWDNLIAALPDLPADHISLNQPRVSFGLDGQQAAAIDHNRLLLLGLNPWRKGPWHIAGVDIDAEWRSDQKWARLAPHLSPLYGRRVLDVGCGNGYYLMRMLGEGANLALGVDPTWLFLYQFAAAKKLVPMLPAHILPLRGEQLPAFGAFDTVFSMGVLYHRRAPIDHLAELSSFLRPGGELVLETLVVAGDATTVLVPRDRYAKMANVWFIPSALALENWLRRAGFRQVRTVDITRTTPAEQRPTEWMTFESLPDFLAADNPALTIEGYPAPTRALVLAER